MYKLYIKSAIKNKVISGIDKFNGGLIDLLDSFDDKCTELGNYLIRKYKFYFEKKIGIIGRIVTITLIMNLSIHH